MLDLYQQLYEVKERIFDDEHDFEGDEANPYAIVVPSGLPGEGLTPFDRPYGLDYGCEVVLPSPPPFRKRCGYYCVDCDARGLEVQKFWYVINDGMGYVRKYLCPSCLSNIKKRAADVSTQKRWLNLPCIGCKQGGGARPLWFYDQTNETIYHTLACTACQILLLDRGYFTSRIDANTLLASVFHFHRVISLKRYSMYRKSLDKL